MSGGDAVVQLRGGDGQVSSVALGQLRAADVARAVPFRRWRSRPGQRHLPGSYWSATTSSHVVYESQLELCRVLLADFDVSTVDIRAQPLRLTAMVGGRKRSQVPDFLLVSVDGTVTVVNVKLASRVADPRVAQQLAWPAALFTARGWGYEVWTGCDATVLANVECAVPGRLPPRYRRGPDLGGCGCRRGT
ncbi:TnsA-like heteromeric transposase endonuclease subunit [Allorhizocola rhizosphaerae]|uniref:TnsA-like heteromeric transposase endonuclease subunit n=1 Tax=Allorhizocola rhizosphaerae TaxID=1872709 RepID=UPI003CCC6263